jgi:hypothetical protein
MERSAIRGVSKIEMRDRDREGWSGLCLLSLSLLPRKRICRMLSLSGEPLSLGGEIFQEGNHVFFGAILGRERLPAFFKLQEKGEQ